jgi:hypothetical protein
MASTPNAPGYLAGLKKEPEEPWLCKRLKLDYKVNI